MQEQQTGSPQPDATSVANTASLEDDLSQPAPCVNHCPDNPKRFCGQPWERQPGESGAAYHAFRVYCNLGPKRTVSAAWRRRKDPETAQEQPNNGPKAAQIPGYWKKWAVKYRWNERIREFDKAVDGHRTDLQFEADREIAALRFERRVRGQLAFESFLTGIMKNLEAAVPDMLRPGRVALDPNGKPFPTSSPLHLARLMKELRILETALQAGFPDPGPSQW